MMQRIYWESGIKWKAMMNGVLVLCALFSVAVVPAIESGGIVSRFAESISGKCVSFDYVYTMDRSGLIMSGEGSVVFQNDSFVLNGNGLEVSCDGKDRWTVDRNAHEAVVESADPENPDYFSYPVLIARDVDRVFAVESEVMSEFNGNEAIRVTLKPAVAFGNVISAEIFFFRDELVPCGLVLVLDDGTEVEMAFSGFSVVSGTDRSRFSFDPDSLGEDYIVTDLR